MQTTPLISPASIDAVDVLAKIVGPMATRARSLIDLNRTSKTYGCADRPYWYYRTLTNFSGSTWQQVALGLAALFKTQHASNPFAGHPDLLEAASASLSYWAGIAHGDGAFDEWYLNEHSYCPTAITGAGVALTLDLIGEHLAADVCAAASVALCRTASWLDKRYNPSVMNQNLAAAVSLAGAAKIEPRWGPRAEAKLARVRKDQSTEGWFPEYSGADLGYSTLALDLLAAYDRQTGATEPRVMALSLARFLAEVQGGWRSLGGRVGSRGTAHTFPFGALYFSAQDPNAADLARSWLMGLAEGATPHPGVVDDRYFAYFYFPQFALAYHQAAQIVERPVIRTQTYPSALEQPESGFVAVRGAGWFALISRRLGGAIALDRGNNAPLYHLGYEIVTETGRFSSANWDGEIKCNAYDVGAILARTEFRASSAGVPLKTLMAPFQLVVGALRTSTLAEGFQDIVKKKMIASKKMAGLRLDRRIVIAEHGLEIEDQLSPGPGLGRIKRLDIARTISMHSPSARQDAAQNAHLPEAVLATAASHLNAGKRAVLSFSIDGTTGEIRRERVQ